MNVFTGTGRLTRNAVVTGSEKKALKLTIATKYGYDSAEGKDRVDFVPCVIFDPSAKLETFLSEEGKGTLVEVVGRVSTSSFQWEGETRYSVEVIVDKSKFNIVSKPKADQQ